MNAASLAGANAAIMAASIAAASSRRRRIAHARAMRRLDKENRTMPNELIAEFIGKEVVIRTIEGDEYHCRLVAAQDNWIKVTEKRTTRVINADSITAISYKHLNL